MYIRHISRPSLAALAVAALIVPIVAGSSAALAQGVNFKGKKITFWTPHRGADSILSLKTWSKYMSKHLPGNPEITVKSKFGHPQKLQLLFELYTNAPTFSAMCGHIYDGGSILRAGTPNWRMSHEKENIADGSETATKLALAYRRAY